MKYKYPARTAADVDRQLRRHEQHEAAHEARRSKPGRAVDLLREEGLDAFADLMEQAKWPKRGMPPMAGTFEAIKRNLVARARSRHFAWGERAQWLKHALTRMAEDGDLSQLSEAEQERLFKAVVDALDKARKRKRR